ncbi:hypothetical protein FQN51_004610 [Onygenales sp. PD_10]|nr:hypothetical protein FQN51_004610 [Onygenales sp. PD_10]
MTDQTTPTATLPDDLHDQAAIEPAGTNLFIDSALMGIALIDVRGLNPIWPGNVQHREVREDHIDKLIASFQKKGIDRCGVNTHLKASISKEHFDAMVTKFVKNNPEETATAIAAVEQMKHRITCDLQQMVHLDLPTSIGPTSPTLEAGQHRRHALIQLNQEKSTPDAPVADGVYLWCCEFYDAKILYSNRDALDSLRANKHDVYRPSDDGDSFQAIAVGLEEKSALERSKLLKNESTLTRWITATFGTNIDNSGRWTTVLRNDTLRPVFANYVSSSYGRKTFSISLADKIVGSKIDQFWTRIFEQHSSFLSLSFGDSLSRVATSDIELLMKFGWPIRDDELRPLFFPGTDDFTAGILTFKGKLGVDEMYFKGGPDGCLPRMNPAYNWRGKHYTTRRPGFLAGLPDDEYQAAFSRIRMVSREGDITDIPTWPSIIKTLNTIVEPLRKLLCHIMFWVIPDWTVPANASHEYRSFQWPIAISKILSNGDGDVQGRAVKLITRLREHISDSNDGSDFKNHLEFPTGRITQLDCPTDSDEASAYQSKFREPHWHQLIPICKEHQMLPFAGCMAVFNDDEMLDKMRLATPCSVQTADSQIIINYDPKKYPELPILHMEEQLREEGAIFGALLQYRRLKQLLINTLCYGFSTKSTVRPKGHQERTLNSQMQLNEAWDDVVRYGALISDAGWEVWPENMAEDLGQYTLNFRKVQLQRTIEGHLDVKPVVLDKTLLDQVEIQKDPDLLDNLKRYAETPEEVPKSGLRKRKVVAKKDKGASAGGGGGAAKRRKKRAGAEL